MWGLFIPLWICNIHLIFLEKELTWRLPRILTSVYHHQTAMINIFKIQNRNKQEERTRFKKRCCLRHETSWKAGKRCGENQGNQFPVFGRAAASIASACAALAGEPPEGLQSSPADPQVLESGAGCDPCRACLRCPGLRSARSGRQRQPRPSRRPQAPARCHGASLRSRRAQGRARDGEALSCGFV